jgi:hypothetical protein
MGIFDKAESEAEDMAQKDPNLAQQAGQSGGGQLGQDMQTAQNMVGQQRGGQDQNQGGQDQNMGGQGMGQDQGRGQGMGQGMGQGGYGQDQNMDPNQQDNNDQDQNRNW